MASTVRGDTAVIWAEDRKVIATFDTGPGRLATNRLGRSHM